jgi:anaerobic nitric oxide reductase transcription regulator
MRDRAGKFEVADDGTLFLDEIGELPLELQPKLLRALQHGEIQRVGSDRVHHVNVRVIAATNRRLEDEAAAGRFRGDLYHRLAAFPLHVPPLRDRRDDVPVLAAHFADTAARRLGLGGARLSDRARAQLQRADWPGNVRELENVVGRGVLRASGGRSTRDVVIVEPPHLDIHHDDPRRGAKSASVAEKSAREGPLDELLLDYERDLIRAAVGRHGGNWAAAARALGLHRSNLHRRAVRLGLKN